MSSIAVFAERFAKKACSVKKLGKFTYPTNYKFLQSLYKGSHLDLRNHYPHKGKTKVLDLYPGIGLASIALYEALAPQQHLMVEQHQKVNEFLNTQYEMQKTDPPAYDIKGNPYTLYKSQHPDFPHLQHVPMNPYQWSTYSTITNHDVYKNETVHPEKASFLPSTKTRDTIHDEFLIHGNLTGLVCVRFNGEALLMQIYGCVHRHNWMQRFGKVRMLFWVRESTALKLVARPGDLGRSKSSLIAETFTNTRMLAISKESLDSPLNKRYTYSADLIAAHQPIIYTNEEASITTEDNERVVLLEIEPKQNDVQDFEEWDYVTRQLFVLSSNPLSIAISTLGSGAKEWFLPRIPQSLHSVKPTQLTQEQFFEIYQIFCQWPFKPDVNLDFYDVFQEE